MTTRDPSEVTSDAGRADGPIAISFEAALAVFRYTLPDCGFKLVMAPPRPDTIADIVASIWRRGEDWSVNRRGRNPAEALLESARAECENRRSRDLLMGCNRCRGLGWFICRGGTRELCDHLVRPRERNENSAPGREGPGAVKP